MKNKKNTRLYINSLNHVAVQVFTDSYLEHMEQNDISIKNELLLGMHEGSEVVYIYTCQSEKWNGHTGKCCDHPKTTHLRNVDNISKYYWTGKKLVIDEYYENVLIPPSILINKESKKIKNEIREELDSENPDIIKIEKLKVKREDLGYQITHSNNTDEENNLCNYKTYQIALARLKESNKVKPKIEKLLKKKIKELTP